MRCRYCGAPDALELEDGPVCEACADERDAEDHERGCDCRGCARLRSRFEAQLRAAEAQHYGGLSGWGKDALGLEEENDIMQEAAE